MALPIIANVQASPQTILEIYPDTTIVNVGETFTVNVTIVDVNYLSGYEFKLGYNTSILEVVDVVIPEPFGIIAFPLIGGVYTGVPTVYMGYDCDVVPDGILDVYDSVAMRWAFGSKPGDPNWNPRADIIQNGEVDIYDVLMSRSALANTFMEMPGTIFSMNAMQHPNRTFSGNGTLATITFEATDVGETVLDLYDTKLSLIDAGSIPHEVRDGTVIVGLIGATQYLITTIESWNLPEGTETLLTRKLEDAVTLLSHDNLNGAKHKLNDFIKNVEALREVKLTNEQADYLIASAQAIIDAIG